MAPSGALEKRQGLDRELLAQKKGERYACGPPGPAQGTEGLQKPHSLIILKAKSVGVVSRALLHWA